MLASLRENSEFAGLEDSGAALRVAASHGASRLDRRTGRGYGIGKLFRALAHDAAELVSQRPTNHHVASHIQSGLTHNC